MSDEEEFSHEPDVQDMPSRAVPRSDEHFSPEDALSLFSTKLDAALSRQKKEIVSEIDQKLSSQALENTTRPATHTQKFKFEGLAHHIQKNHLKADPSTLPRMFTPSLNTKVERRATNASIATQKDTLPTSAQRKPQDSSLGSSSKTVKYIPNLLERDYEYKNLSSSSSTFLVGSINHNLTFWKDTLQANNFVLNVISSGYLIPFFKNPSATYLNNNISAIKHACFVETAIKKLLDCGAAIECKHCIPHVVNPLTVSVNVKDKIVYTDASSFAAAGYTVETFKKVVHKMWTYEEKQKSPTYRELKAVLITLNSLMKYFHSRLVKIYTDNQNVVRIITAGSMNAELQVLAIEIFNLCVQNSISIEIEWVPREKNKIADFYSKIFDFDDWHISDIHFKYFNSLWGPFTCDVFADSNNNKVPMFFSPHWCPGTGGVDAFAYDWSLYNCWIVLPIKLISRSVLHLSKCQGKGVLVTPKWTSSVFWPIKWSLKRKLVSFIC
ncbi:unnamed protein product [Mytilus coruscus]|uniref:RNase H type-1 domain-containing protein n=1 Tax=Mytilus coruscus TaxID=42192 RepID=A0A6J8DGG8_MYTCO|nr:unnamed protein product [Mytilus coruscus]